MAPVAFGAEGRIPISEPMTINEAGSYILTNDFTVARNVVSNNRALRNGGGFPCSLPGDCGFCDSDGGNLIPGNRNLNVP